MPTQIEARERRILRPLRKGLQFFLLGFFLSYLVICFTEGWGWAIDFSSWYVFKIVRIVVALILTIAELFILPFKSWDVFYFCLMNSLLSFPIIGILYGLSIRPKLEDENKLVPTIYLFWGLFVVLLFYFYEIVEADYTGYFVEFIFTSDIIFFVCAVGIDVWLFFNLKMSIGK